MPYKSRAKRIAYSRKWSNAHQEYRKAHSKSYYHKNKNMLKRRRQSNPEKYKKENRRAVLGRHGITINEFEVFRKAQNNRCRICQKVFDKTPTVDHSHKTGAVRGLLCGHCNSGLGMFKDSLKSLKLAIKYLKETER